LRASLLSLALHSAVMLGVVPAVPLRIEMPAARLQAVLGSALTMPPADFPVAKAKPSPKQQTRESAEGAVSRTVATVVRPAVAQHSPRENPSAAQVAPNLPSARASEQVAAPGHAVESGLASAVAPSSAGVNAGVSADDMRRYRLSLAISARRFKRYPALARERGWEGIVEVAIVIEPLLPAPQVNLSASSGIPLLDEQAMDTVAQAARNTLLPEGLKGRGFRVLLPVKFSLDADQ
jgi:protein TonB